MSYNLIIQINEKFKLAIFLSINQVEKIKPQKSNQKIKTPVSFQSQTIWTLALKINRSKISSLPIIKPEDPKSIEQSVRGLISWSNHEGYFK